MNRRVTLSLCLVLVVAQAASAATCMNKFLRRSEGSKQVVTLLTGKMTYQEAQDLAKKTPIIEWLDDKGKTIAKSADLKIVRPMPVGCDGKTSGVVMIATFLSAQHPTKKMSVKLDASTTVTFDEQSE